MKVKIQMILEQENEDNLILNESIYLERNSLSVDTLGISLNESKNILEIIQKQMVEIQIEDYINKKRKCTDCKKGLICKDKRTIIFNTLFGKLTLDSPRFYSCNCSDKQKSSFSPLAQCLTERTSPELLYLQSKWSSLMSYGLTVSLIEEVLPININIATTMRNTHKIAKKLESELGDENVAYIEGAPIDWAELPTPGKPLTVGIDGGYVKGRSGKNRKEGHFEVIVGKSMQDKKDSKRFGFVSTFDKKSKRRLFDTLVNQGMQMNQTVEFFSDGGDNVRNLQLYLNPNSEFYLDWFHITMRITVLQQMCKGLIQHKVVKEISEKIASIKWYLWHGNTIEAIEKLDWLVDLFYLEEEDVLFNNSKFKKLEKTYEEFVTYIENNAQFIPDYSDRYNYGETITTSFVESTVNEVISKRMSKKQQMRWTREGAHLLLQVRIKTLNNELRDKFCEWYPKMSIENTELAKSA